MKPEVASGFDRRQWRAEQAEEALRTHGCRVTRPRVAVLQALLESGGAVDAATLTVHAQRREPGIHEATVYRTVNVLTELGIVNHVHAGHGPALLRLAGDEHVVAVCHHCGAIEPVPVDAVETLVASTAEANGFTLEPGHFALEGSCAACTSRRDPTPAGRRDD